MTDLTDLHKDILAYCADDYTDLSCVVSVITKAGTILRHLTLEELQDKVLGIIRDLLVANFIQAGDVNFTRNQLEPWPLDTDAIINRIRGEWNNHRRGGVPWPDPWEIVCFVSTIEGDRALAEGQPHTTLQESEDKKAQEDGPAT